MTDFLSAQNVNDLGLAPNAQQSQSASNPNASTGSSNPFLDPNATLGDVHPALANTSTTTTAPPPPPAASNQVIDPTAGTLGGALAGAAIQRITPTMQMPNPPGMAQAQVNNQVQSAAAQRLQQNALNQTALHGQQLNDLQTGLQAAHADLADATTAHANALSRAQQLNVPEEVTGLTTGDKWAFGNPEKGTTGVIGSEHAGGTSVTEAAENYRLQESLTPSERAKFKVNRKGIFIPNELPTERPLSDEQKAAKDALDAAKKRVEEATKKVAEHKTAVEKLTGQGPLSKAQADALAKQQELAQKAADRVRFLEEMQPGKLATFGKFVSKIPGVLSGAGAGLQAAQAANEFKQGEYGPAIAHGAGALGGTLMSAPNPYAKGIGALMLGSGLAYDAYQALK